MAQSAHTVALMSGMFLVLLGLIWDRMAFPPRFTKLAYWLFLYSTYSAWGSMFIAAFFGTSRNTPFASKRISGAARWQETITDLAYLSFFITIVLTCLVTLWGLRRGAALGDRRD
jgi:hydroxylaminobenzene mutase